MFFEGSQYYGHTIFNNHPLIKLPPFWMLLQCYSLLMTVSTVTRLNDRLKVSLTKLLLRVREYRSKGHLFIDALSCKKLQRILLAYYIWSLRAMRYLEKYVRRMCPFLWTICGWWFNFNINEMFWSHEAQHYYRSTWMRCWK